MSGLLTLLKQDLIDSESEVHYAWHKSLHTVTGIHNHDFFEVCLIPKGAFFHMINGRKMLLEEGSLVFIRPQDVHYYESVDNRSGELINLAFPERTFQALQHYLGPGFDHESLLNADLPPTVMLRKLRVDFLVSRFEELTLIPTSRKQGLKAEARSILAELFMCYFTNEPPSSAEETMPAWLEDVLRTMKQKENFTAGMARMHELSPKSPEHLCRTMRKHTGLTPTQWINEIRLQYAANLLSYTDESILSVCLESGFENLSHFNHQFKRHFRCSPSRHRKLNRTIIIPEIRKPAPAIQTVISFKHKSDQSITSMDTLQSIY